MYYYDDYYLNLKWITFTYMLNLKLEFVVTKVVRTDGFILEFGLAIAWDRQSNNGRAIYCQRNLNDEFWHIVSHLFIIYFCTWTEYGWFIVLWHTMYRWEGGGGGVENDAMCTMYARASDTSDTPIHSFPFFLLGTFLNETTHTFRTHTSNAKFINIDEIWWFAVQIIFRKNKILSTKIWILNIPLIFH